MSGNPGLTVLFNLLPMPSRWNQIDFEKRTVTVGRAKTQAGTGRLIPLNQPAFEALALWAGRLVESKPEDYVFPSCEAAGIEREHPDKDRVDPSKPITSWRSAWRAALKRAKLQLRFHDLFTLHYQAGRVPGQRAHPNGNRGPCQPEDD